MFYGDCIYRLVVAYHFQNNEQIARKNLDLRTLIGVDQVFKGEWMEIEASAQLIDHFQVMDAAEVDPSHRWSF
jgi:hypothetical protein